MKIIIQQYGGYLLDVLCLSLLITLLFSGIRDEHGNQGVHKIVGAEVQSYTKGKDYKSYTDYDVYRSESDKEPPKIVYGGIVQPSIGNWYIPDSISATDYRGESLLVQISSIVNPDGMELVDSYNSQTKEVLLASPGIYEFTVSATDRENRKTTSRIRIPVNR